MNDETIAQKTARLMKQYEDKLDANIPLTPEEQVVYLANVFNKPEDEVQQMLSAVPVPMANDLETDITLGLIGFGVGYAIIRLIFK